MNWATSGGCCWRTSETKYPAIAWLRTSSARAARAGSLRRAATAPPSAAPPPTPRFGHAAAPGQPRRPPRRSSPAGRGFRPGRNTGHGRAAPQLTGHPQPVQPQRRVDRPASTSWAVSAASARPDRSCSWSPAGAAKWKSSTMITDPAGSFAASFAIDAVTSADMTPSIASRSAASAPNHGATIRGASMKPVQKRTGSASASSHDSQDVTPGGLAAAQLDSSTLLPAPADPTTTVRRLPAPAVSRRMQRRSCNQRGGQRRRPELRQREPRGTADAALSRRASCHDTPPQFPLTRKQDT